MKRYIIISMLLISSYVNGQDTASFSKIDSIVAAVDFTASEGRLDTLRSNFVSRDGRTSEVMVLKQGREVQKIISGYNKIIFQSGEPVFRQAQGPSSTWKYYLVGGNEYLYFKEDNKVITLDGRFNYNLIDDYLRLFKGQINSDGH
jgi:hypothetical protein